MNAIGDKSAIVGIGQTPFSRSLGRFEFDMAIEAIFAACDDAGVSPRAIDGVVRYDMETTDEENLLAALGNPEIRHQASTSWGGGGSVSVLVHAAVAITAGMADTVLVFRSRARGKTSVFGKDALQGGSAPGRFRRRRSDASPPGARPPASRDRPRSSPSTSSRSPVLEGPPPASGVRERARHARPRPRPSRTRCPRTWARSTRRADRFAPHSRRTVRPDDRAAPRPVPGSAAWTLAASTMLPVPGPRDCSRRTGTTTYASCAPIGRQRVGHARMARLRAPALQ
jgi:hypothetical protein